MDPSARAETTAIFPLLADPLRLRIVAALARSDERVTDLAAKLAVAEEPLADQLNALQHSGLVTLRRSDADPIAVYAQLSLDLLRERFQAAALAIHPGLLDHDAPAAPPAPGRPRVLFLCTHNSARSQMAEGLLRHLSRGEVEAFSAGSAPSQVNPLAVETMAGMRIDISGQRSKHVDELLQQPFDYVITVCDNAREVCPVFPGQKEFAHWSIPDPSAAEGEEARRWAFKQAATQLQTRIRYLVTLIERDRREPAAGATAAA